MENSHFYRTALYLQVVSNKWFEGSLEDSPPIMMQTFFAKNLSPKQAALFLKVADKFLSNLNGQYKQGLCKKNR